MSEENTAEPTKQETNATPSFGEDLLLVTDADISEEVYGSYQGFKFNCPVCKTPSIMVNADMIPICLKCGRKVLVRSQYVEHQLALRQEANKDTAAV